mmetsp:Transcript_10636/g.18689  ORF Transcript_10636/g.18689 Transcript_10636/m.18689 type:complete len:441 (-) Transcript_10636:177-1499(-)
MRKYSNLFAGTIALLLAGKEVKAFSSPPSFTAAKSSKLLRSYSNHQSDNNGFLGPLQASTNSDHASGDDLFDYDQLMNSNVEKNRLTSMYSRFGHKEWLVHRASDRFYRNLFELNKSPIVESLLDEVALLVMISLGIIFWNGLLIEGYTDLNGLHHDPLSFSFLPTIKLSLPMDPFLLCGGPLGLLLVFRNDASFGRYNEALAHWEKIVSNFQNMMLMASTAAPQLKDNLRELGLANWALVRTLQHEVSGEFDPISEYEADIKTKLPSPDRAEKLLGARHKLYRAQYDIHQAIEPFTDHITVLDKRTLINTVNDVALQCVECERLYTTPIPLLYTRHTLKFLTIWMTLMPLALYDVFAGSWNHIALLPAMTLLTFLFFGIEEIAVSLEEPFSILPLDELVDDVWVSIDDVLEWSGKEGEMEPSTGKPAASVRGEMSAPAL